MAELSMDVVMGALQGAFGGQTDGLRRVLATVVQAAMSDEVQRHLGAGRHERAAGRSGHRNGYKPRTVQTRVGALELAVPQVRGCDPYHPGMFARWQRSERALLVACAEMYFQGVSTRNVTEVLGAMCDGEVSATTVSRVAAEVDERLAGFRDRRLGHTAWPYLMVDARYEKVRVDGRVVSQAVLVVIGFTAEGRREVLDWRVGDSEAEAFWGGLFRDLKDRGLGGVEYVVSDAHGGIRSAMARHFQGSAWQRCRVHFKRELMRKVSHRRAAELMKDAAAVFAPDDRAECLRRAGETAGKWRSACPAVAAMFEGGAGDCLTVLSMPEHHRNRLASTNMAESLMKRLKKRTAVVGIFPNRASCDRLIGAQLLEVHEDWQTEPKAYFNMEQYRVAASAKPAAT